MKALFFFLSLFGGLLFLNAQSSSKVNLDQLNELKKFSMETDADGILVLHQNEIIEEWYNPDCDSVYMNTASLMKSLTSVMIGTLLHEGLINSEEDLVCDYWPEWKAGCENKLTIKHLLTMTSGIKQRRSRTGPKRFIFMEKDFNGFMMEQEPDTIPGAMWSYSNEGVQALAPVIEKACGMEVEACFREKLFKPLEMDSTSLFRDPSGNAVLFGGAKTTLRDISKIGQLMLNKGLFKGERLLSEEWITKATSPIEQNKYYGYLWWVDTENGSFTAMGDFGQMCIVYPEKELIFVRYQTCSNTPGNNMKWMGPDFIQLVKGVISE